MKKKEADYDLLIELIQHFKQFAVENPSIDLEVFAFWLLRQLRQNKLNAGEQVGTQPLLSITGQLNEVLVRLARQTEFRMKTLFQGEPLSFTDFRLLQAVEYLGHPRKIEVIQKVQLETTTATAIMKKLVDEDYLWEIGDEKDKRSKRLGLTDQGRAYLKLKVIQLNGTLPEFYPQLSIDEQIGLLATLRMMDSVPQREFQADTGGAD